MARRKRRHIEDFLRTAWVSVEWHQHPVCNTGRRRAMARRKRYLAPRYRKHCDVGIDECTKVSELSVTPKECQPYGSEAEVEDQCAH
jgi:hypothetical protein